ncbi:2-oxo acid dehydrogenase subunit E2 [Streptomyces sp. NPDC096080]|uniref:2-oxo acid dehydrogenase subunit E2 n=1 Tax=Streptomyces sp. NPDC096080 TaxID=3156693 RepID=UPI003324571D
MNAAPLAPERRPTFYFLDHIKSFSPVFLDTEVDMTAVLRHRADARAGGQHYSLVSYVVHAAGRVLARHPEANAAIRGSFAPKVARFSGVSGKVTFDKTVNGRRVVLSTVLPDVHEAAQADIQRQIETIRDGDPETMPQLAKIRALRKLPVPLGRLVFRTGIRGLTRRPQLVGTFAVTSLGHSAVDSFHSVGGTTVTLGVGRMSDRPVVRDGAVTIAPMMRLSLAFDHRVIDGAEAADVLTDLKTRLEEFGSDTQEPTATGATTPEPATTGATTTGSAATGPAVTDGTVTDGTATAEDVPVAP